MFSGLDHESQGCAQYDLIIVLERGCQKKSMRSGMTERPTSD